jgi:hypothetical protein
MQPDCCKISPANSSNSVEIFESFAAAMTQPDKNYRNKQD